MCLTSSIKWPIVCSVLYKTYWLYCVFEFRTLVPNLIATHFNKCFWYLQICVFIAFIVLFNLVRKLISKAHTKFFDLKWCRALDRERTISKLMTNKVPLLYWISVSATACDGVYKSLTTSSLNQTWPTSSTPTTIHSTWPFKQSLTERKLHW